MRRIRKIKWLDHESKATWESLEDIKEWALKREKVVSYGFVVYEDSEVIIVCSDKHDDGSYGCCTKVYKKLII